MCPTITVIGGGLSGSLVAAHLLRRAQEDVNIVLIERRPQLGRGVAYSTGCSHHLLNVPAGKMSAFDDDPEHFLCWLHDRSACADMASPHGLGPDSFVSRQIYGEYMTAVLAESEARAHPGARLTHVRAEALVIERELAGCTIRLSNGTVLRADQVVLALGNLPPTNPPVADPAFYSSARYIHDPWCAALAEIDPTTPILLLGSGLTMVDLAIALEAQGHTGTIYVVSRRGLMPQAHQVSALHASRPLPPCVVSDSRPQPVTGLLRRVRREAAHAAQRGEDWRPVLDALRSSMQGLWSNASDEERRRFLRHLRPYWDVHRHRIAPKIAATINKMLTTGQLNVRAGRLQGFMECPTGVDVRIRQRCDHRETTLHVGRVINCTGPSDDYRKAATPLIQNLLAQGLVRPGPLGCGLAVDPHGALLDAEGVPSDLLFTLGPPCRGQLWETTAAREIRAQAANLAERILRGIPLLTATE